MSSQKIMSSQKSVLSQKIGFSLTIAKTAFLFMVLSINVSAPVCFAAINVYHFDDPRLEKRFQHLSGILRCPKCQNQNLAGSNSPISEDLKSIVREKLIAGETDEQILTFMKQRYGEFVLFEPEMSQDNWFLWSGPLIFIAIFTLFFVRWYLSHRDVNND